MAKFLNLGRMNLEPEEPTGGPSGGYVARPTGMRLPTQYASAAQMMSTQPAMPVPTMQPIDQPTPPTVPPTTTPDVPDPGLVCPGGTVFDPVSNRCVPQYPMPETPTTPSPTYPVPPEAAQQPSANGVPPGHFALLGRVYPKWWLYVAGGSLGFGTLLLAIFASRRRRRVSA